MSRAKPPRKLGTKVDKCRLFIGGLSWSTTHEAIRKIFEKYGPLTEARVHVDPVTGNSKGFGFVTFEAQKDADAAQLALNGQQIDKRTIRVDHAMVKPDSPSEAPPRGGRPSFEERERDVGRGRPKENTRSRDRERERDRDKDRLREQEAPRYPDKDRDRRGREPDQGFSGGYDADQNYPSGRDLGTRDDRGAPPQHHPSNPPPPPQHQYQQRPPSYSPLPPSRENREAPREYRDRAPAPILRDRRRDDEVYQRERPGERDRGYSRRDQYDVVGSGAGYTDDRDSRSSYAAPPPPFTAPKVYEPRRQDGYDRDEDDRDRDNRDNRDTRGDTRGRDVPPGGDSRGGDMPPRGGDSRGGGYDSEIYGRSEPARDQSTRYRQTVSYENQGGRPPPVPVPVPMATAPFYDGGYVDSGRGERDRGRDRDRDRDRDRRGGGDDDPSRSGRALSPRHQQVSPRHQQGSPGQQQHHQGFGLKKSIYPHHHQESRPRESDRDRNRDRDRDRDREQERERKYRPRGAPRESDEPVRVVERYRPKEQQHSSTSDVRTSYPTTSDVRTSYPTSGATLSSSGPGSYGADIYQRTRR